MRQAGRGRATIALAALTFVAWVVAQAAGLQDQAAYQGGFIPLRAQLGGQFAVPFVLTPLTATLVHGGLLHLGFNLLLFLYCGRQVEQVLGWKLMLALYVAGAFGSALAQYAVNPMSPVPMIGASGAISAVLAVYALLYGRNEVKRIGPLPAHWVRAAWLATAWVGLQLLITFATRQGSMSVATAAHVGGFVTGLILARPLLSLRYRR